MTPIIVFILLAFLSYISVFYIRRLALRHQILDHPNERSSHSIPMPRGGGLAIVLLTLGTCLRFASEIELERSLIYIILS
ncbi:MAG TPA: hypothetical protein VK206_26105, partial [Anaerolineales bacterium]|nr:hypothetical protein [Anaerolineales bacterium]